MCVCISELNKRFITNDKGIDWHGYSRFLGTLMIEGIPQMG